MLTAGDDVNTYDAGWSPSPANENQENIRVLEWTADHLPRRLVWKLIAEENSNIELWRLYSGFRYDTGTIDVKTVTEQECLAWAEKNLTFTVDQEADQVKVVYDGDVAIGALDVSAYKGWKIESAQISPDVCGFDFEMDREIYGEELYGDYEGVVVYIGVGLKLEGDEEIWIDGLHPLALQIVGDESEAGFKLQQPKIDRNREIHSTEQQRRLKEVQKEEK